MLRLPLSLLITASLFAQDAVDDPLVRIESNSVLGRLKLAEIPGAAPFRLYHQVPSDRPAAQRVQVEALFAPWLVGLGQYLERDLWPALGGTGPKGIDVVVTARLSYYRSLQRTMVKRMQDWERTAWQPKVRALVTYHDQRERTAPTPVRVALLRHATLRLLLARSKEGEEPVGLWALDGLATAIAQHEQGTRPGDLGSGAVPMDALNYLSAFLGSERTLQQALLPLADLASTGGAESRHLALSRSSLEAGMAAPDEAQADYMGRAQGELWAYYLAYRPEAVYRQKFLRYVRGVLEGKGDADALFLALGVQLESLDRSFRAWLVALGKAQAAKPKRAREVPIAQTVQAEEVPKPAPTKAAPVETEEDRADPAPVVVPGPRAWSLEGARHPALMLPANDLEGQLASAMGRAVQGELSAALDFLDRVRAEAQGPEAERLEVEHARLEAVRALRERVLIGLAGTQRRLRMLDGEDVLASPVESIDGDVLRLGRNRHGLVTVSIETIGPADLRSTLARRATEEAPAWLVAYLELLAGKEDWADTLEGDGPEAQALREQGPGLVDLLPVASLRCELSQLAQAPLPEGSYALRALLDRTGTLLPLLSGEENAPAALGLRFLASEAAESYFDLLGVRLALHGSFERLEGDRVKLRYDFEDPRQLEDFVDRPKMARWTVFTDEQAPRFEVEDGALLLNGFVSRRLRLPLAQPTISINLKFSDPESMDLGQFFSLLSGLDRLGQYYARTGNGHDLFVIDKSGIKEHVSEVRHTTVHKPIKLVLQHHEDGTISLDGDGYSTSLDGSDLDGNGIGFQVRTVHVIRLLTFEVEGRLTDKDVAVVRKDWVAGELERLGF